MVVYPVGSAVQEPICSYLCLSFQCARLNTQQCPTHSLNIGWNKINFAWKPFPGHLACKSVPGSCNLAWKPVLGTLAWQPVLGTLAREPREPFLETFLGTSLKNCLWQPCLRTCSWNLCLGTCSWKPCLRTWQPCLGTCSWKPCLGT